jgi:hypothetical protein
MVKKATMLHASNKVTKADVVMAILLDYQIRV